MQKIEAESHQKKKTDLVIQDKKIQEILIRLDKLETSLYFLNSSCSLQNVAKKIKTNTSYLSKIIGTHKGKKFTEYINELRIQYVLKRLKEDSKFRKYSIKNILRNKFLSFSSVLVLTLLMFFINVLVVLHSVSFKLIDSVNSKLTISLYLKEENDKNTKEVVSLIE